MSAISPLKRKEIIDALRIGAVPRRGLEYLAIGLDRFGASAPAKDLFRHFGFTAEAIVPRILEKLSL